MTFALCGTIDTLCLLASGISGYGIKKCFNVVLRK